MGESERSEAFGIPRDSPLSSGDAAELEQLRREAAVLREQLENAVGSHAPTRSARDIHQLEARIDSLAARNSKLMETLKEARQQLLALREEVDRLGQPPSGYGVLLATHDDDTVDVFTSGRKMRLTCSPNIDAASLKKGQTVRLNEALTVVEAGTFEAVGEISTLREILADVADFGCGSGRAVKLMAQAFGASRFTGIDFSDEAVAAGTEEAARLGLANATFERHDLAELDKVGAYDVITVFDAIHDQAQPARVLQNIYRALRPGGVLLLVDIKASSQLEDNVGVPLSTYLYTTSLMHCMTVSLALDGAGLGTVWGRQLATSMLADAGFTDVTVAEIESDVLNNYYIARK